MSIGAEASRRGQGFAWGRYTILTLVGEGSSGVVYAAYDPVVDRRVALKFVQPTGADALTAESRARFLREAQAMGRLSHPNVLAVYDACEIDGTVFIAMEFVEGVTLRHWLQEGPRSQREIIDAFLQAGRGLAAAHAAGMVHRDFKPDNVLVDRHGRVRVTDFGLARPANAPHSPVASEQPEQPVRNEGAIGTLTETGAFAGTPAYMAPEQLTGAAADQRTDQFGFCVALYEALYGERPFEGETLEALVFSVTTGKVRQPPKDAKVPVRLRRVLLKGLSVAPEKRFASLDLLLAELARDPARIRRRWKLAVAGVLTLCALGAGYVVLRPNPKGLCHREAQQLGNAWNDDRRRAVEEAIRRTGRPFSEDAAQRAIEALDAYSASWIAVYRDVCEATRVRGEQSENALHMRMACLERRQGELAALADVLSGADAKVAERAVQAAKSLRAAEVCLNADALATMVEPADPKTRGAIDAVRATIAKAEALLSTGQHANGLELARTAVTAARPLEYPPVLAEALLAQGELEMRAGNAKASETVLMETVVAADRGRHDEVRARAWTLLVWAIGVEQSRFKDAHLTAELARSTIDRLGSGYEALRVLLLSFTAVTLDEEGRYEEALARYEEALALGEKVLPPAHPRLVSIVHNIGLALSFLGRHAESVAWAHRAIGLWEQALGPMHPKVASTYNALGGILADSGDYLRALEATQQALAIQEKAALPDDASLVPIYSNLAAIHLWLGEPDLAKQEVRRVIALQEKAGEKLDLVSRYDLLSQTELALGRPGAARAAEERALAIARKLGGPEHRMVALALSGLGRCALAAGNATRALDNQRQALAIDEKSGPDHADLARDLTGMGNALLALRRPADAVAPLERARALRDALSGDPFVAAETAFSLARALWESGRERARALAIAKEARERLHRSEGRSGRLAAQMDPWIRTHTVRVESAELLKEP